MRGMEENVEKKREAMTRKGTVMTENVEKKREAMTRKGTVMTENGEKRREEERGVTYGK
jgi:hypothetical protein